MIHAIEVSHENDIKTYLFKEIDYKEHMLVTPTNEFHSNNTVFCSFIKHFYNK